MIYLADCIGGMGYFEICDLGYYTCASYVILMMLLTTFFIQCKEMGFH